MADSNLLKRLFDAGAAFTQLTQARAEAIVKDLVNAGEVQTNQAQATVAELIERSRENTERLLEQVRTDIRSQVASMGLATKADIARLENRISSLSAAGPAGQSTATTPAKRTATKTAAQRTSAASSAKPSAKPSSKPSATSAATAAATRSPAKAAAKKR
ncbi:MAG: hypothetical protein M3Z46_00100 [Actinomycetota bacterium]|nr:hypothetical protein [Actinomycetota bacterium]